MASRDKHREFHPATEVTESESDFTLSLDLPGVPEADVHVDVDQGRLRVHGERPQRGRFDRHFTLPNGVDESAISARFAHGVLEISVPKASAPKPRAIAINAPAPARQH